MNILTPEPSSYMDKYQKLFMIGEGSFGKVFQALEKDSKKTVAIKIISKNGRSLKELQSLKRECDIQKHLSHPNIIQFLESFETYHEFILITQFAHTSLSQLLEKQKKLKEELCLKIICNLVSALHYLHSNRVLHRDLKPQNVLLKKDGTAVLCDFGFARSMAAGTHVLTSIKGTPLYMAPELIEERPYDHTADLWSLGCIAYEIHMGHPPFKTMSILQLIRLLKTQDITFPSTISSDYKTLILGLLEKDSNKRLTWPHLLHHPFIKDKIHVEESDAKSFCYDAYNERRGSRKSITTLVENENNDSEEWINFLKSCLKDLLSDPVVDDSQEMCQQSFILMLITSLRSQSCQVFELITDILVILMMKKEYSIPQLKQVYLDTRVVSNILLAIKNIVEEPAELKENTDASGLQMFQRIFMFLNFLVYADALNTSVSSSLGFLHQFCDTIVIFKLEKHLGYLLLLDYHICSIILSILLLIVSKVPDNSSIVYNILKQEYVKSHMRSMTDSTIHEKMTAIYSFLTELRVSTN